MKVRYGILFFTALLLLSACGSHRQANFKRQKFTHLKPVSAENTTIPETQVVASDVPVEAVTMVDVIETEIPHSSMAEIAVLKSEVISQSPHQDHELLPTPDEFNHSQQPELSSDSKAVSMIFPSQTPPAESKSISVDDFDNLYRSGAMLFLLFALFMVMAIFAVSPYMFFICCFTSPILFFACWIMGIFLAFKSLKIPKKERGKLFKLKMFSVWAVSLLGLVAIPVAGIMLAFWL